MKKIVVLFLSLSVLIVVAACGDQSEENNETATEDPVEQQEDNDDQDESEDTEDDDSELNEAGSDGEYLRLGETGVMEMIIGDFEVIPTEVRYVSEITEEDSVITPSIDTFIIINTTITNVDNEPFLAEDMVSEARLDDIEGASTRPKTDFASIDKIEGELAPGESIEGELVFDFFFEEEYILSFGSTALESASNVQEWKIYEDEIDSE